MELKEKNRLKKLKLKLKKSKRNDIQIEERKEEMNVFDFINHKLSNNS
jgi:hypothetical protein